MPLWSKAPRLILLVPFAALLTAQSCVPGGPPSWKAYASLTASTAALPVRLVVGPSVTLADAQSQANAVGCGVEIVLSGTLTGNLLLTPHCPDPEGLGIRVRGPATLYGGIRVSCAEAGCGWVSVEQLAVVSTLDDAYDVSGYGRMAVINATGQVSGAYSNVLTAHDQSALLALNTSGASLGSDLAPPVALIQRSSATLIGRGTFTTASAPNDEVISLGGGSMGGAVRATVIGHSLVCRVSPQSSIDFAPGMNGSVSLESGVLQHGCPAEALLDGTRTAVTWRMLRDRLAGLTLASPGGEDSDLALEIDSADGVLIGLAVPIPAWVDGSGTTAVTVAD
jgi:hypothetical protein